MLGGRSHLTDVIKYRLSVSEYRKLKENPRLFNQIIDKNIRWLKREIAVLGSNFHIIAIGKETFDILKRHFHENLINIWLPHYSWVERYAKNGTINVEKRHRLRKAFIALKRQLEYANRKAER